jgi:hypothetical protein
MIQLSIAKDCVISSCLLWIHYLTCWYTLMISQSKLKYQALTVSQAESLDIGRLYIGLSLGQVPLRAVLVVPNEISI